MFIKLKMFFVFVIIHDLLVFIFNLFGIRCTSENYTLLEKLKLILKLAQI